MAFLELSAFGIIYAFSEIIAAPFANPELIWFSLPLLATLIVIELNIRKSGTWVKQAAANAIVLLFISLDLFRITFRDGESFLPSLLSSSIVYALIVLGLSILIILMEFRWKIFPNKTVLGISIHLPINTFAYTMMVMVYNKIEFTLNTIGGIVIFMVLLYFLFYAASRFEPQPTDYSGKRRMDPFTPRRSKEVSLREKKQENNNPTGTGDVDLGGGKLVWLKKEK